MNPPDPFDLRQMTAATAALALPTLGLSRLHGRRTFFVALASLGIPALGLGLWVRGDYDGMLVAWAALLSLAAVVATLPFALLLRRAARPATATTPSTAPKLTRRALLLQGASVAAPLAAAAAGPTALLQATAPTEERRIRIALPRLPPALEGTCIMHLSDLHLGASKTAKDLERFLAASARPDLVLVTGDFADVPRELERGLALLGEFGPPVYASLGNHEYLRGIDRMLPRYRASKVRLLRDEHALVRVRGSSILLVGIDDPAWSSGNRRFFDDALDGALAGSPSAPLRILLSHRPRALDAASARGIDLVLSGHTHGAQLGILGRSMLEPFLPREYLWGTYAKRGTLLYTTSGFGHWFPFRLGCPTEAPLLVLERTSEAG